MGVIVESWFARTEAILLGRNTFETMRAYWSQVTDPANGVAAKLNHGRKYVVSNTMTHADWGDSTVVRGDIIGQVADIKKGGRGELQVHGSARLAQGLHAAGLIDEYRLLVFPVTVGAGKRLFTDDAPPRGYSLLESRATRAGAVYQVLAPKTFEAGGLTVQDGREAASERASQHRLVSTGELPGSQHGEVNTGKSTGRKNHGRNPGTRVHQPG